MYFHDLCLPTADGQESFRLTKCFFGSIDDDLVLPFLASAVSISEPYATCGGSSPVLRHLLTGCLSYSQLKHEGIGSHLPCHGDFMVLMVSKIT